jgi:lysophospholipase L1-like esterase
MLLDDDLIEFDPIIGKRLRPGIQRILSHPEWGEYVLQTNNCGFRCSHDFSLSKKPGFQRILLFGDSNAFGNGVSNEVRFPDMLEKLIPNIEVYNFAMEGFALDQQYLCYQENNTKFEHDLILIAPAIETIRKLTAHYEYTLDEHQVHRCYVKPYFELVDRSLVCRNIPLLGGYINMDDLPKSEREKVNRGNPFAGVGEILEKAHLKDAILETFAYQPFPEYDNSGTPAWRIMRAILKEWMVHSPIPFLVIPLPRFIYVREKADAKNYQARFQELSNETKCFLYDPLSDLHKLSMEERRKLYYLEGHLTPQGHAWMAKAIAPHVHEILRTHKMAS